MKKTFGTVIIVIFLIVAILAGSRIDGEVVRDEAKAKPVHAHPTWDIDGQGFHW